MKAPELFGAFFTLNFMESPDVINGKILRVTEIIQSECAELIPFLNEMPMAIPTDENPLVSRLVLEEYYHSLLALLLHYYQNHYNLKMNLMKTPVPLAVYMDHFTAKLIEFNGSAHELKTIHSDVNVFEKKKILRKDESHLQDKEQAAQQKFYQQIAHECQNYAELLLFGPTSAKAEFHTLIGQDHRFAGWSISMVQTDQLSEKQQISFVNHYFTSMENESYLS